MTAGFDTTRKGFADLTSSPSNYREWSDSMEALLKTRREWRITLGDDPEPEYADADHPTRQEKLDHRDWADTRDSAAGTIYLSIDSIQQSHVRDLRGDPERMWDALKALHQQQKAGPRFLAYDKLFSITKQDDEDYSTVLSRLKVAMTECRALRPSHFGLQDLEEELQCMIVLRSLPEDRRRQISSLFILNKKITVDILTSILHNEDNLNQFENSTTNVAMKASVYPPPSSTHTSTSTPIRCTWCTRDGHSESDCFSRERSQRRDQEKAKKPKAPLKPKATEETASQASTDASSPTSSNWTVDTGASRHMTPHRSWFHVYAPYVVPIRLADNSVIYSAGVGSVVFRSEGEDSQDIEFHDVLHVPRLRNNLFSPFHLTRQKGFTMTASGAQTVFEHQLLCLKFTATVTEDNTGYLNGRTLNGESKSYQANYASQVSTCPMDLELWHRRFCHIDVGKVQEMVKQGYATGISLTSSSKPDPICEPCISGKQHRHAVPRSGHQLAKTALSLIHSDVKGPLLRTAEGFRYWVTFIDDATRIWAVYFLRKKSEVFSVFKEFKAYAEASHPGLVIAALQADGGGEYIGKEFQKYCRDHGIVRRDTETNEPYQNGVAERANRTIIEGSLSLLTESKLPPSFWGRAVTAYVYTRNRSPTSSLPNTTPYISWTGNTPDLAHLRVFGCLAYVLVLKKNRTALQSHTRKCIFVGNASGTKAWIFWQPDKRTFVTSSHAIFDERVFPGNHANLVNPFGDLDSSISSVTQPSTLTPSDSSLPVPVPRRGGAISSDSPTESEAPSSPTPMSPDLPAIPSPPLSPLASIPSLPGSPTPPPLPPRPSPLRAPHEPKFRKDGLIEPLPNTGRGYRRRGAAPRPWNYNGPSWSDELPVEDNNDPTVEQGLEEPSILAGVAFVAAGENVELSYQDALEFAFDCVLEAAMSTTIDGPKTMADAMSRPKEEADKWWEAANKELEAMVEMGVFELVRLPPDRKAIGSRWVFKVKLNADGTPERYKARLVAKGYAQRPGFDYSETFSPTPKWASIRAILALAALEDLELWSVDISSAFLNGELNEEVYMQEPEGFVTKDRSWALRLRRAIYGLKQAGRQWHITLHNTLVSMGFKRVRCEHSVWVYDAGGDARIIIPVFVDDMTIVARSQEEAQKLISLLSGHFKLRDLGPTSWLLGVEIQRDRSKRLLTLSQRQYTEDILDRAGMADCNPVTTPLDPNIKLNTDMCPQTAEEFEWMRDKPYIHLLGAIAYLAVATRPDIAYAVGVLARFSRNPGKDHWNALKRVLRYLKGTVDFKLTYSPDSGGGTELFTTYSDADYAGDESSSRSTSGWVVKMGTGAVSWMSRLQSFVTLSTTEAEYVSAVSAGQEILWLRNLFTELGYPQATASTLKMDNQSAISVARNPDHHGRMKHLDLRFYWLRDVVDAGTISVSHIPTNDMAADILTKALGREKLEHMNMLLGLRR